VLFKKEGGLHKQVVEIEGVVGTEDLMIAGIDFRKLFREEIVGLFFESFGIDKFIFQRGYGIEHFGGRKTGGIEIAIGDGLLYTFGLVGVVVNAEVGVYLSECRIPAEDANAEGMKCAYERAGGSAEREGTLAHFLGGLIGEGYGADIVGRDARFDEGGDAEGYDAGLAAAGAGDNKQGAFAMTNGLLLRRGKPA